ncbi:hypothetical protein DPMN_014940 [Dreissena polymorpha]|uniref:peptidyl-tRNA hydrolase n=1 Tax=Dreissena polymorpha TaxID=45954 RepID=A0A9D4S3Z8_DREPO|nr:hypothetical protein DPMN_014940 [Dreissena polymorpha]
MIAKEHIMATAAAVSVGVGIGVVVGWLIRGRFRSFALVSRKAAINREIDLNDNSPSPKDDGEYKMVIVVRTDLKMGRGKAAAQCAHGALGAAEKCLVTDKDTLYAWKACGQPKVLSKQIQNSPFFDPAQPSFELGRDFIGIKLLTKFHEDGTRNVASRVFTSKCLRTDRHTTKDQSEKLT